LAIDDWKFDSEMTITSRMNAEHNAPIKKVDWIFREDVLIFDIPPMYYKAFAINSAPNIAIGDLHGNYTYCIV